MKTIILVLTILISMSSVSYAAGGIECETLDKTVSVSAGDGPMGTWIKKVKINGVQLVKDVSFSADNVYSSSTAFNFVVMDAGFDEVLLRAEMVVKNLKSAGLVTVASQDDLGVPEVKVMVCEFTY